MRPAPRPVRFAVLFHHGIPSPHYDLLLETNPDAPLATWQFPLWPPVADRSAASPQPIPITRLPDHRPLYLTYEGPVSNDRGHVRRIAAGLCNLTCESSDEWRLELPCLPPLRLHHQHQDQWLATPAPAQGGG